MKVFLSWSGDLSHKIACAFRDWLPNVLQYVQPYVSSEDIDKGARWSTDIAKELESSVFGLMMITKDNFEAPWISFEAGALSKTIDKSKVAPFLFNIKRAELQGPLLQFQSTIYTEDDISKLIQSINKTATPEEKLDDGRIKKVFDVWWPELKEQLDVLIKTEPVKKTDSKQTTSNDVQKILEEILEISRNQFKIINSPESMMPPNYIRSIMQVREPRDFSPRILKRIEEQRYIVNKLEGMLTSIKNKKTPSFTKEDIMFMDEMMMRLRESSDYLLHYFYRDKEFMFIKE